MNINREMEIVAKNLSIDELKQRMRELKHPEYQYNPDSLYGGNQIALCNWEREIMEDELLSRLD